VNKKPEFKRSENELALAFLGWQCRLRQLSCRQSEGRPTPAMMPDLILDGELESLGTVLTILNKLPQFSQTKEFKNIYLKTHDPKQRREDALRIMCESYYQLPEEFSDLLTAAFVPSSSGVLSILEVKNGRLEFSDLGQRYSFAVAIRQLSSDDASYQATFWHNALFSLASDPNMIIIEFEPDWSSAVADP